MLQSICQFTLTNNMSFGRIGNLKRRKKAHGFRKQHWKSLKLSNSMVWPQKIGTMSAKKTTLLYSTAIISVVVVAIFFLIIIT
jgi:hypothetical protein